MIASVAWCSGCSDGKPVWEQPQPTSGVVKFKGRPLKDAEITFFPEDPSFPETVRPQARSGDDGKFVAWTYTPGDGVPAGRYKLTVIHQQVAVSNGTIVAKPNDLPAKYALRDSTDLMVDIAQGHNELTEINLK